MSWLTKRKLVSDATSRRNSKYEEVFESDLTARGIPYAYESVVVRFTPPVKECRKTWDWEITTRSGKTIVVETKGYWERKTRLRETAAVQQNPGIDIRYVFQNASTKIGKGSKTTYGMWCSKHDIKWAHARIPEDWLNE